MQAIGALAGIPFLFAGIGNIAGGWFSGLLIQRGQSADRARKAAFLLGCVLCASSALVPLVHGRALALTLISVATFGLSA